MTHPEDVIDDMRSSYRKCLDYLQTKRSGEDDDKLRNSFRKQMLLVSGFKEAEIEKMDESMSDGEFQEVVRRRLLGGVGGAGRNAQVVVSVGDVDKYLSRGWGFVASLPNKKVVLSN